MWTIHLSAPHLPTYLPAPLDFHTHQCHSSPPKTKGGRVEGGEKEKERETERERESQTEEPMQQTTITEEEEVVEELQMYM